MVTSVIYMPLVDFTGKLNFQNKGRQTQLRFSKIGSLEFPNQHLRQIGPGFPELCLDKQTEINYNFIYIEIQSVPINMTIYTDDLNV